VVGFDRAEQHEQRGRLAGPVGTEQRHPLTLIDREADVGHGGVVAEPLVQVLDP